MKKILAGLALLLSFIPAAEAQRAIIAGESSAGVYVNIKTDASGNLYVTAAPAPSNVTFTNTTPTITNATTVAITANAARQYLQIQNNDAAGNIFCTPTAAATTANGVKLTPGQAWAPLVAPINAINCIGSIASNANVIVTEGQ